MSAAKVSQKLLDKIDKINRVYIWQGDSGPKSWFAQVDNDFMHFVHSYSYDAAYRGLKSIYYNDLGIDISDVEIENSDPRK